MIYYNEWIGEKMNILFVVPYFPPDRTVGTVRMASLVRFIYNDSYSISIMTNYKETKAQEFKDLKYYYVGTSIQELSTDFKKMEQMYCNKFYEIYKDKKIDLIIISGGPFYSFKISVLAKKMGIPCILDFRDPWVFDKREVGGLRGLRRKINKMFDKAKEYKAVASSKAIVTVTDGWAKEFSNRYNQWSDKIYLIENGFDESLFNEIHLDNSIHTFSKDKITLGVFGKLFYYTEKYSQTFLNGVYELKKQGCTCSVLQIGDRENIANNLLDKYELEHDVIKSTGFLEYKNGVEKLSSVQVFLIIDNRPDAVGTKIYDYIYLNKPIVYVGCKESAIADQLKNFKNAFICSTEKEVVDSLKTIVAKNIVNLYDELIVDKYSFSRKVQNGKWKTLIDSILKANL